MIKNVLINCVTEEETMNLFRSKTTTPLARESISPECFRVLFLIPLALAWFALSPTAQAQLSPPPDGGYPNNNTAEGTDALFSLTTGPDNTALGFDALFSNTTGDSNTATGSIALMSNTTGVRNTANGFAALNSNTTGERNTATGRAALTFNTTGNNNTADGHDALFSNGTGIRNTATGSFALFFNTTGNDNAALGYFALYNNTTGNSNTAEGFAALMNNTAGVGNMALGNFAGANLTTGDNNIDIGNQGAAGEAGTIRIGAAGAQTAIYVAGIVGTHLPMSTPVFVNAHGQLGTTPSSQRFKADIKPMDKASEAILALKPVTFRYKHELDPDGIPQFGLVAEQVEKINPDLVARDAEGKVFTVRYEAVNAMLLNEFLKEHRTVQKLEATVAQQQKDFRAAVAQQQTEIKALTATLREQASQIQKVHQRLDQTPLLPLQVDNSQ
jgi:endosialidase-like protein